MRTPAVHKMVKLAAALTFSALCMGQNCLNPCQQLATKICSCEETAAEQQACNAQVTAQQSNPNRTAGNEDLLNCQEAFRTCECRGLKAGDLASCGLAKE